MQCPPVLAASAVCVTMLTAMGGALHSLPILVACAIPPGTHLDSPLNSSKRCQRSHHVHAHTPAGCYQVSLPPTLMRPCCGRRPQSPCTSLHTLNPEP